MDAVGQPESVIDFADFPDFLLGVLIVADEGLDCAGLVLVHRHDEKPCLLVVENVTADSLAEGFGIAVGVEIVILQLECEAEVDTVVEELQL